MTRRELTAGLLCAAAPAWADGRLATLRGKLTAGGLLTPDGQIVKLEGDEPTEGVLHDDRVQGMDLEVTGQIVAGGAIRILPIHKQGLFVLKDGKKLFVTYWCEVCSIRTYTPGKCLCCQDETQLDLRDKLDN